MIIFKCWTWRVRDHSLQNFDQHDRTMIVSEDDSNFLSSLTCMSHVCRLLENHLADLKVL